MHTRVQRPPVKLTNDPAAAAEAVEARALAATVGARDAAGEAPRLDGRAASLLRSDEQDVFIAKCKDFYDSPHTKPGEPCPSAVWECLFCRQCVVTATKLPKDSSFSCARRSVIQPESHSSIGPVPVVE